MGLKRGGREGAEKKRKGAEAEEKKTPKAKWNFYLTPNSVLDTLFCSKS